ncbi:hypothetical protein ACWD3J_14310 [Streptomyces sp. NPDC002755]
MNRPTELLNQTLALGTNPDDITYTVQDGFGFIVLGSISISVSGAGQATLDALAAATARAAAETRANILRGVA